MRIIAVISIQNVIYSTFTIVEMLSQHDRVYAKLLLAVVFLYLAFLSANVNGYTARNATKLTFLSLVSFLVLQRLFWWFTKVM